MFTSSGKNAVMKKYLIIISLLIIGSLISSCDQKQHLLDENQLKSVLITCLNDTDLKSRMELESCGPEP